VHFSWTGRYQKHESRKLKENNAFNISENKRITTSLFLSKKNKNGNSGVFKERLQRHEKIKKALTQLCGKTLTRSSRDIKKMLGLLKPGERSKEPGRAWEEEDKEAGRAVLFGRAGGSKRQWLAFIEKLETRQYHERREKKRNLNSYAEAGQGTTFGIMEKRKKNRKCGWSRSNETGKSISNETPA